MCDTGLLIFIAEGIGSGTDRFQMIEVVVSVVFRGSFFDIFFGGGLDKFNCFLILTYRPITTLTRTMRMTTITLITSITRVMTSITSTQPIHKRRTLTTFLQQMLTSTTNHPNPGRGNPITVPVLPLNLIHFIIMFSRRPFRHLGHNHLRCHLMDMYMAAVLLRVYIYLLLADYSRE